MHKLGGCHPVMSTFHINTITHLIVLIRPLFYSISFHFILISYLSFGKIPQISFFFK